MLCSGSLFYRINDSYRVREPCNLHYLTKPLFLQACFEVSEVEKNVQNIGTSAMRSVLGTFTYDQVRIKRPTS